MRKLRGEMHRRLLGNGYCARPVSSTATSSRSASPAPSSLPRSSSGPPCKPNATTPPARARWHGRRSSTDYLTASIRPPLDTDHPHKPQRGAGSRSPSRACASCVAAGRPRTAQRWSGRSCHSGAGEVVPACHRRREPYGRLTGLPPLTTVAVATNGWPTSLIVPSGRQRQGQAQSGVPEVEPASLDGPAVLDRSDRHSVLALYRPREAGRTLCPGRRSASRRTRPAAQACGRRTSRRRRAPERPPRSRPRNVSGLPVMLSVPVATRCSPLPGPVPGTVNARSNPSCVSSSNSAGRMNRETPSGEAERITADSTAKTVQAWSAVLLLSRVLRSRILSPVACGEMGQMSPSRIAYATACERLRRLSRVVTSCRTFLTVRSL
jgi:hypothetical protein